MTSKRISPVAFKIYFLISISTIILGSVVTSNEIDLNRKLNRDMYPQIWDQNNNFVPPFASLQPKYIPDGVQPDFRNFLQDTEPNYIPEVTRTPFISNFNQLTYIPDISSPNNKKISEYLKKLSKTGYIRPWFTPEVAKPKAYNEVMQRKILGLMMGTASEKALHQMHLHNPGILNTLAGKIIPLNENSLNKTDTGRRTMYAPIIHNTIVNENKNENLNENIHDSPRMTPYLLPADPNFPLLTHLLESVIKNSKNPELAEHSGHKPIRICFEL